jgi:hypothetical protein
VSHAERARLAKVSIGEKEIDRRVLRLVPEDLARLVGCPMRLAGYTLYLAVSADPGDRAELEPLWKALLRKGWSLEYLLAEPSEIESAIERNYGEGRKEAGTDTAARQVQQDDLPLLVSLPRAAACLLCDQIVGEKEMILAARKARASHKSVLRRLAHDGHVDDERSAAYLASMYGVAASKPDERSPTREALSLVPRIFAKGHICFPMEVVDGRLCVAVFDPCGATFWSNCDF